MSKFEPDTIRAHLLECLQAALQAVAGRRCVTEYFSQPGAIPAGKVAVIAIGKAAVSMMNGAVACLGPSLQAGLVITKAGYGIGMIGSEATIEVIESAHPIPDTRSLTAGRRLIDFIETLPVEVAVIFLISGGTSALVEVLPEGVGLGELQTINEDLLATGVSIDVINRIRGTLSLIKGGGLLNYLAERPVISLLLSDVPNNEPAVIGSGLLYPAAQADALPANLPAALNRLLSRGMKSNSAIAQHTRPITAVVGDNRRACEAAARAARDRGYAVHLHTALLTMGVQDAAEIIFKQLSLGEQGIHIWGGEPTVCLPAMPGRGGRNQQLALLLAQRIRGLDGIQVLVSATDGSDGPGEDAGGLVDGGTLQRGQDEGFDSGQCLQAANAGTFLEASGDLISTGPTGTNVMDIVIAWKG